MSRRGEKNTAGIVVYTVFPPAFNKHHFPKAPDYLTPQVNRMGESVDDSSVTIKWNTARCRRRTCDYSWKTPTAYYLSREADKEELQETEEQHLKPWTTPHAVCQSAVWTSHRVQGFCSCASAKLNFLMWKLAVASDTTSVFNRVFCVRARVWSPWK